MPFVPAVSLISEVRADFLKEGRGFRNFSARFEMDNTFAQNNPFTGFNTETATKGYTLFNAGVGVDLMTGKGKLLASIYLTALFRSTDGNLFGYLSSCREKSDGSRVDKRIGMVHDQFVA